MTINEVVHTVLKGCGKSADDFPLSKQLIYRHLIVARNELIKQELNKRRMLDGEGAQIMHCITLKQADASECLDCNTGIYVLKSEQQLPESIQSDFGTSYIGVFLQNGVKIDRTTKADWGRRSKRRYQLANQFGALISNGYLHVVGYDPDVEELTVDVESHFNQPEKVELHNHQVTACDTGAANCLAVYDLPFQCPGHLLRRTIELATAPALRSLGIPQDRENNTQFDASNVQSKT